jgi:predicted HAD superfamily Cof-like phosphohydrolase
MDELNSRSNMSRDWQNDIRDLMKLYGQNAPDYPQKLTTELRTLRFKLILEEFLETAEAMGFWARLTPNYFVAHNFDVLEDNKQDLAGISDGIVDSIVVLLGAAIAYGIDIQPIWDMVHTANLAKAGGPKRSDGKRLKPEGWTPPNVQGEIDRQINGHCGHSGLGCS